MNSRRRERLAAEEDDEVLEERAPDLGHRLVGKRPGQVDAVDLGAERAREAPDFDRAVAAHRITLAQNGARDSPLGGPAGSWPGEYSPGPGYFDAPACDTAGGVSGIVHPPPSARKRSAVAARCWRSASARFSSASSSSRSASIAASWLSSPAS